MINFTIFSRHAPTRSPQKGSNRGPPAPPGILLSNLIPTPIEDARFWFVVVFFRWFCGHIRPRRILFAYIYHRLFCCRQTMTTCTPQTFFCSRAPSPMSLPWPTPKLVGCCVPQFKCGLLGLPPLPLSLIFCRFILMTEPTKWRTPTRSTPAARPP